MAKRYDQPEYSERRDRDYTSDEVATRAGTPWFKKLSWGSIFAGLLVALVAMLLLNLLGLGIGLSTINPVTEQDPMSGIGTGAIIWWVISNLLAIFAGAYVAARTAGIPLGFISSIHGILTWCAYTLVSFWLLTTAVGGIISGVGSVISTTVSAVGSGIEAVAGGSGSQQQNQQQGQDSNTLGQITSEVQKILRQTEDPALQPDSIKRRAQQNLEDIKQTVRTEETLTNEEVQEIWQQILNMTQNLTQEIDREDVVNVITARTDLSEQTVNNVADVVVRNVQKAQQEIQQFASQAEQQAEEAAQNAAEAASSAAIWSFFALLLGLGAAFAGGKVGTPKHDVIH